MGPKEIWRRGICSPYIVLLISYGLVSPMPITIHSSKWTIWIWCRYHRDKITMQSNHTEQPYRTSRCWLDPRLSNCQATLASAGLCPIPSLESTQSVASLVDLFLGAPSGLGIWSFTYFFILVCLGCLRWFGYFKCSGQRLYNGALKRYLIIPRLD